MGCLGKGNENDNRNFQKKKIFILVGIIGIVACCALAIAIYNILKITSQNENLPATSPKNATQDKNPNMNPAANIGEAAHVLFTTGEMKPGEGSRGNKDCSLSHFTPLPFNTNVSTQTTYVQVRNDCLVLQTTELYKIYSSIHFRCAGTMNEPLVMCYKIRTKSSLSQIEKTLYNGSVTCQANCQHFQQTSIAYLQKNLQANDTIWIEASDPSTVYPDSISNFLGLHL